MDKIELKRKKLNIPALKRYGFIEKNDIFEYSADICGKQFRLNIYIKPDGIINTKLIDQSSKEEYVLHLVETASGSFVGYIRQEYETVICDIAKNCYEADVFKTEQAKEIINHIKQKYGGELEFLWQKFPDNAVWRRKDNNKWYAALLTVSKRKLGFDSDEKAEIIDLRMKPEDIEKYVDGKKYFPGYHMNKKHWCTIILDFSVSAEEIFTRIDESFELALK